jgi:hypothetical protein
MKSTSELALEAVRNYYGRVLKTGQPMLVGGNSAAMVQDTRYRKHFRVTGDHSTHFGPFDCGPLNSGSTSNTSAAPSGACC